MTTLWARMLIIKAWEKGEISEECAKYFDDLLNENRFINVGHEYIAGIDFHYEHPTFQTVYLKEEISDFKNVLKNIGQKTVNKMNPEPSFDVLRYINKSSFKFFEKVPYCETIYLANIIGFDYPYLNSHIKELLKGKEVKVEDLNMIKLYLEKTSNSNETNNLIKTINKLIKTKNQQKEFDNIIDNIIKNQSK